MHEPPRLHATGLHRASQIGERARQVPLLVFQPSDDDVVPPLVGNWTAVSELLDKVCSTTGWMTKGA